jgi:translation initiation factor 3 subunit B
VEGAPKVGADKKEKLEKVLLKHAALAGAVVSIASPSDAAGTTTGYVISTTKEEISYALFAPWQRKKKKKKEKNIFPFSLTNTNSLHLIEFSSAIEASECVNKLHELKLDKAHTLLCTLLSVVRELLDTPDELVVPALSAEAAAAGKVENLHAWLGDARAVAQYAVVVGQRCEVYWNEQKGTSKAELVYARDNWTESFVTWSPLGTYFVTMHRQGIALWGGPSWKRLLRFAHAGCEVAQFSPRENYLITFSPQFVDNDDPDDPKAIIVWDVRTGKALRGFLNGTTPFGWSHDDSFFARLDTDRVQVYETPSMGLHQKKSLHVPGVAEFAWSPVSNTLAYYMPASDAKAAAIVLVEFPTRRVLRSRNLFDVTGVKLHWHPQGTFLCAVLDRLKTKKSTVTNFDIFRMLEKDLPVDTVELDDTIAAFAWEPRGKRFAYVHGDGPRHSISFRAVEADKVTLVASLDKKPANSLFWSPRGKYIVLAGLRNLNGQLEFYNVDKQETMATEEHFMASSVEWDATGLFVATVVSAWRQSLETGVSLFSFHGQKVHSLLRDQFYQLAWRPQPPSVLTPAQQSELEANLDSYIASIQADDAKAAERIRESDRVARRNAKERFANMVADARRRYDDAREKRIAVFGFDPDAPLPADQVERIQRAEERVLESIQSAVE